MSVHASFEHTYQAGLDALSAGRPHQAVLYFKTCIALQAENAQAWFLLGASHDKTGQISEAEQAFFQCLLIDQTHPQAANAQAAMLMQMGRTEDAIAAFHHALARNPNDAQIHTNIGIAHEKLGLNDLALTWYNDALKLMPAHPGALNNRGALLLQLRRPDEALQDHLHFVQHAPHSVLGYYYCGASYSMLHRDEEALTACDAALKIAPLHTKSHFLRGITLSSLRRVDEARQAFEIGRQSAPKQFDVLFAETGMDRQIIKNGIPDPVNIYCLRNLDRLRQCNWQQYEQFVSYMEQQVAHWTALPEESAPDRSLAHTALALPLAEQTQHDLARSVAKGISRHYSVVITNDEPASTDKNTPRKIRIAYISPDFKNHATAHLTRSMYALHDREKFTIYGYALNPDDGSEVRQKIAAGCDVFHDVSAQSTETIAALIRQHQIDIIVDLAGYTADARTELFMQRPAPVSVAYLGYAGSVGSECIDYFISTSFSSPSAQSAFYDEKIVLFPGTCFPYDEQQKIDTPKTRADYGLPEDTFVFCCFNNSWKIEPAIFNVWMRLLHRLPRSALWLYESAPDVRKNLQIEAGKHGIAPSRLVFATFLPVQQHLARYQVADLFLDTFFYGAHTTAMDALWAGLPLIARPGRTYASRVSSSHLAALDMPELIAASESDYEELAFSLATDPARLQNIREKLARHRTTKSLFRTSEVVRNLEQAYRGIWRRHCAGLQPESFTLNALAASHLAPPNDTTGCA